MRFAIFGAGGFGREIVGFVRDAQAVGYSEREVVFVTDNGGEPRCGLPVIGLEELTKDDVVVVAVADSAARGRIVKRCEKIGVTFGKAIAPESIRYDEVEIAEGAILCAGSIITTNVKIGRHFHLNLNSYVAHDCRIGEFVTFAPNVACNGNVTIGDRAYIGTGALIMPGVTIGADAIVGMGSVVIKDVLPGRTVVGNPARHLHR